MLLCDDAGIWTPNRASLLQPKLCCVFLEVEMETRIPPAVLRILDPTHELRRPGERLLTASLPLCLLEHVCGVMSSSVLLCYISDLVEQLSDLRTILLLIIEDGTGRYIWPQTCTFLQALFDRFPFKQVTVGKENHAVSVCLLSKDFLNLHHWPLVRDLGENSDLKDCLPRMVFPVALFPTPVFPTITTRSSASLYFLLLFAYFLFSLFKDPLFFLFYQLLCLLEHFIGVMASSVLLCYVSDLGEQLFDLRTILLLIIEDVVLAVTSGHKFLQTCTFLQELFDRFSFELVSVGKENHAVSVCFFSKDLLNLLHCLLFFICESAQFDDDQEDMGSGSSKNNALNNIFSVLVSNIPGVSITATFCPSTSPLAFLQSTVRDSGENSDSKYSFPKMVFPVALFPAPVFPTITIRSASLLYRSAECEQVEQRVQQLLVLLQDFRARRLSDWIRDLDSDCGDVMQQPLIQQLQQGMLGVPCSHKLEAVLRQLRCVSRDPDVELRPLAAHLFSCKDDITQSYLSLGHMVSCYNQVLQDGLQVERPLIQDQLQDLDQDLAELQSRTWGSTGVHQLVQQLSQRILKFHSTVSEARANMDAMTRIIQGWAELHLLHSGDFLPEGGASGRSHRCITEEGQELLRLTQVNCSLYAAGHAPPAWSSYLEHIDDRVQDALLNMMHTALTFLCDSMSPKSCSVFLTVSLQLQETGSVFEPSVGGGLSDLLQSFINDVYSAASLPPRISAGHHGNYQQEPRLSALEQEVMRRLQKVKEEAELLQVKMDRYSHLWQSDRQAVMQEFLTYSRQLGPEELEAPEAPPTLNDFQREVSLTCHSERSLTCHSQRSLTCHSERSLTCQVSPQRDRMLYMCISVFQLQALSSLQVELSHLDEQRLLGWLKVELRPFRDSLLSIIQEWSDMYTQHLLSSVSTSLQQVTQHTDEDSSSTSGFPVTETLMLLEAAGDSPFCLFYQLLCLLEHFIGLSDLRTILHLIIEDLVLPVTSGHKFLQLFTFLQELFDRCSFELITVSKENHAESVCFFSKDFLNLPNRLLFFICESVQFDDDQEDMGSRSSKNNALPTSFLVLFSSVLVSNRPGVSMTATFCPSTSPKALAQALVRDLKENSDLKYSFPRMVFPVALFPAPVFPTITIRSTLSLILCFSSSSSLSASWNISLA
ncbi:hypothetical protein F7725_010991 [Dissostichus mawsoni]|uniref:Dynein heavy chain tail domain-containing protein n=1 Tax=Dissostichus mawsoni TaxID=36200 RepID=A0A7J5Z844_DISMA|nr:hypothetical protein F7725_010991 [Dissostichus mawsoni]